MKLVGKTRYLSVFGGATEGIDNLDGTILETFQEAVEFTEENAADPEEATILEITITKVWEKETNPQWKEKL